MKAFSRIVISFGVAGLVSCSEVPTVCTANALFGVTVAVRDSVTGGAPTSPATIVVRDVAGTFADSGSGDGLSSALERTGTYRVDVRAAGYRDWTASNVVVTQAGCHVKPVALIARLQRAP
jgi:hypothetical protein